MSDPFVSWSDDGVTTLAAARDQASGDIRRPKLMWKLAASSAMVAFGVAAANISLGVQGTNASALVISAAAQKEIAPLRAESLASKLDEFKSSRGRWRDLIGRDPDPGSLTAALRVAELLPAVWNNSRIGLDDEGYVFFHLTDGPKDAVLTVEHRVLHLLFRKRGEEARHLDDVQFDGRSLPKRIASVIERNLNS